MLRRVRLPANAGVRRNASKINPLRGGWGAPRASTQLRPEPARRVRYISTRGEAPPLGFLEATLAGLAHDGGLYVPASFPHFDAETIAAFAGRPYAEVAVEVMRPFIGEEIADYDLARITREAYGNFRHPAITPLVQFGVNAFMLEFF